jgi:hypothetical protein
MKTEHEIAKENIKNWKRGSKWISSPARCNEHKQTCQRWLEFLEKLKWTIGNKGINDENSQDKVRKKITDLKQTIKEYEDNGI